MNEQRESHLRVAAGLSIKNCLVAKDAARLERLVGQWRALDAAVRAQIKQLVRGAHRCDANRLRRSCRAWGRGRPRRGRRQRRWWRP